MMQAVKIMTRDEAHAAMKAGNVRSMDGRKPVAIGLIDKHRAVLLLKSQGDEYVAQMHDWVIYYQWWRKEDAL